MGGVSIRRPKGAKLVHPLWYFLTPSPSYQLIIRTFNPKRQLDLTELDNFTTIDFTTITGGQDTYTFKSPDLKAALDGDFSLNEEEEDDISDKNSDEDDENENDNEDEKSSNISDSFNQKDDEIEIDYHETEEEESEKNIKNGDDDIEIISAQIQIKKETDIEVPETTMNNYMQNLPKVLDCFCSSTNHICRYIHSF